MNTAIFKRNRTWKGFELSKVVLVSSSVLLASLIVGCKSNPTVPQEDDSNVAAEVAPEVEVEAENNSVGAEQQEADADAMMASLAAKSKYDKVEEQPKKASPEKAQEQVKAKVETKESAPKAASDVKQQVSVAEQAPPKKEEKVKSAEVSKPKVSVQSDKPEEVPVQPEEVVKTVAKVASSEALDISVGDLPADIGLWTIREGEGQLDDPIVVSTPTWEMGEEGYNSQIWLTLMAGKTLINSSSDIYAKEGQAGIKIDGGDLIPFSRIESNNTAVIEGDILDKLATGKKLEILMGFFPDRERKSDLYKSDLDLDDLGRVVATYRNLIK